MERTWTISIVGIIVALGGLGFIAIFFAVMGHFFTKNSKRKATKSENKSNVNTTKKSTPSAVVKDEASHVVSEDANVDENDELVAVISAAIASFDGETPRILSVKKVRENVPRSLWRFHDTQMIWRINRTKGKGALKNG